MARVFLSYAREDVKRAGATAQALERAGHAVWWDRHLVGGSEYAPAIEAALADADAVVVLWSKASVASPWVRDEAARGRDRGCLVPAALDESEPPLGFRQFHVIDLSGWSGRSRPKQLESLIAAVDAKASLGEPPRQAVPLASRQSRRLLLYLAAPLLIAAIFAAAWLLLPGSRAAQSKPPTIAVLPFADFSPEGNKDYFAEGMAEEIRSILAREPGLRILGRSSSLQIRDGSAELQKSLGVTHVLEGSSRTSGDSMRVSVRLLDAATGTELWSDDYQRQLHNVLAVQDEIGRAVAEQLKITLASPVARGRGQTTSPENYALYLQARSKFRERTEGPMREAFELAREVVKADPDYAPGHALLAETTVMLSYNNYGKLAPARAAAAALPHARRAIEISPSAADGHAALGLVLGDQPERAVEPLDRAVRLDPARSELRLWLAIALSQLGRNSEALEQFRALAEMEPLWQPALALYSVSLGAAGQFERAEALIDGFRNRGGNLGEAVILRGRLAEMRGDFSQAAERVEEARRLDPRMGYTAQLLGWYYHILALPDRAAEMARAEPQFTRLALSDSQSELVATVRRSGAKAMEQPDADVAVAAAANARDWPTLIRMYESWRPQAAAGCLDLSGGGIAFSRRRSAMLPFQFAVALERSGRAEDSRRLLNCLKQNLDRQSGGPIRYYGLSEATLNFSYAQIAALRGERAAALDLLGKAIDAGWRGWYRPSLSAYPALDSLRSSPEFGRLESRLRQLVDEDRRQLLARRSADRS